jgi:hypothetical protein
MTKPSHPTHPSSPLQVACYGCDECPHDLVRQAAPIAEIQAEKRRDIIEVFIRDNLYADSGEVVELQAYASVRRKDRNESSKNAA